jgi:creatinine amidohydrolase/Fe(II)-dependent formamide hydrolase-like protein
MRLTRSLLAAAWMFLAASPAVCAAATTGSVFIEDLTWTELRDRIAAGATTILVPIGGTEQNGAHMALGKHNVRVRALAEKIARSLGNALVAPVIAYAPEGGVDPPTGHMRFAGTISIPTATFEQLLEGAARSLKSAGFRDIVMLGDHGDYQSSQTKVAAKLNREWKSSPVRVHPLPEYYAAARTSYARTLQGRGFTAAEIGTHAGVADTSLALAIDPKLVRTDALPNAHEATSGVYGDARRASAELGAPGIDIVVNESVAAIRRATKR